MRWAGMAGATVNSYIFHEIKGDNVQITEDIARWNPVASGAITFSKEPLRSGVSVILDIEGSGRISLGIIKIDPQKLKNRPLYNLQDISEYIQINEVRVHKRKCSIKYALEPGGDKVVTTYNDKKFRENIRPGSDVWLAVYVKFGEVTLRLKSEEADHNPILSEVIGMNLEFCTDGKNEVRTVSSNPAAICLVGKPLNIGQKMSLFCEPLKDGRGELPSQFCLKIYITDKDPKQLERQHKNLFTVTATNKSVPQWACSEIMEKLNCNGQVTIERAVDHVIFTNGMNERTKKDIYTDQKSELWIALDLYRVLVIRVVSMDTVDVAGHGYITAVSVIQELKDNCPPPARSVSVHSYMSVTGNDSDSQEENTTPIQEEIAVFVPSKLEPSVPAEDQVRFESSFNGNFVDLVKDLSALELCDHLISLQVITMAELEKINSKNIPRDQNRELLCLLGKRPVPKSKFIDALKETGNKHLTEKFFPDTSH